MPLERQVIDLNWKVAHGVLYTAERYLHSVTIYLLIVSAVTTWSLLRISFFHVF